MKLKSLKDTENLSKKFANIIKSEDVIFLYGEIGTGKTTFVRFLINHLEVENQIKKSDILSPTFNIVYDYEIGKIKIHHYDLYRLKNYKDISQLGIFDTSDDSIKIIEWPELIEPKPQNRIDIRFQYFKSANCRKVEITGFGKWKRHEFFKA